MKKILFGLLAMASAAVMASPTNLGNYEVCFFSDANYQGDYYCQGFGDARDFSKMPPGWNDRVSSVAVGSSIVLEVFEHENFGGWSQVWRGSNAFTANFNDKVSSFKLHNWNATEVSFYRDGNFQGPFITRVVPVTGPSELVINLSELGINDWISSIGTNSPNLFYLTAYEHSDGTGRKWVYTNQAAYLGDANDQFSLLKLGVSKNVCLYDNEDYSGQSVCYNYSGVTREVSSLGSFNDRASSMTISPGLKVYGYDHEQFGGNMEDYEWNHSNLNGRYQNNKLSSIKIMAK